MNRTLQGTTSLQNVLKTAHAMLAGETGLLEGCISMARYAHDVVPDWRVDADFVVFGAIAGSIDHLPFGEVRSRWSVSALGKADTEIAFLTEQYQARIRVACEHVVARFSPGKRTTTLFRPVGPKELDLIAASGWREFPPRLPDQPIFYPVTNQAYAIQIARDWNVKASGAGFVTKFEVDAYYLSRYKVEKVGGAMHTEYWIPAEDLPEFNRNIIGLIVVTDEYR